MRERNLRVLEFTKIRDMLAALAISDMGRERIQALEPSSDPAEVRDLQQQTEEAGTVIAYTGGNPMLGFEDVREHLKRAAVGATLDAIASALATGEKVTLSGFGTFETRRLPARAGRNPRTGEAVMIAARKAPAFKPCKGLKEKVNG